MGRHKGIMGWHDLNVENPIKNSQRVLREAASQHEELCMKALDETRYSQRLDQVHQPERRLVTSSVLYLYRQEVGKIVQKAASDSGTSGSGKK